MAKYTKWKAKRKTEWAHEKIHASGASVEIILVSSLLHNSLSLVNFLFGIVLIEIKHGRKERSVQNLLFCLNQEDENRKQGGQLRQEGIETEIYMLLN
jgi:hypothetical protein